jgi:hypothetical protein
MMIMSSQQANSLGAIKIPIGRHTQAEKETLKELNRNYFPGSDAEDVTWQRQMQLNLGTYTARREDRELSTSVIDQSKIRWAINTFKLFNLAQTDDVLMHSCNRESNT